MSEGSGSQFIACLSAYSNLVATDWGKTQKGDGVCRECGGQLQVVDADDATMTVLCDDCSDEYLVEPDAFGDGGTMYYVGFLAEQAQGVPDEPDDIEGDSAIDEE